LIGLSKSQRWQRLLYWEASRVVAAMDARQRIPSKVAFASKMVVLESGKIARGKIDQQGHFVLGTFCADDGAVAGLHHVIVVQSFDPILWDSGRLERPQDVSTGDDQPDRVEQDHEHEPMFVSRHFASYATSGLTVEVDPQRENVVELVVGQPVRGEEGVH
jgi:hypothetical protein